MKANTAAIALLLTFSLAHAHAQKTEQKASCCSIVEQALASAISIKPGMSRAEVEKNFVTEGGLDFRVTSFYTYKACPLIKIRVEFSTATPGPGPDSPKDIVKSVSQPYLEYPVRD